MYGEEEEMDEERENKLEMLEEEERATQEQVQTSLMHLLLRIKEELP